MVQYSQGSDDENAQYYYYQYAHVSSFYFHHSGPVKVAAPEGTPPARGLPATLFSG